MGDFDAKCQWGMVVSLSEGSPAKVWTDASAFMDEKDVEELIEKGAKKTNVHFFSKSQVKVCNGAICYLTLLKLGKCGPNSIEDSPAILSKVGPMGALLRNAGTSPQLYALRASRSGRGCSVDNTGDIGGQNGPVCNAFSSVLNARDRSREYSGVLNREYFIERGIDIGSLAAIRFYATVGPIPVIRELIVAAYNEDIGDVISDYHSSNVCKLKWASRYEEMGIPLAAGMTIKIPEEKAQYKILCCLPYDQGILRPESLVSTMHAQEPICVPEVGKDASELDMLNIEDSIMDGILVRKISLMASVLKKYESKLVLDSGLLPTVYASWKILVENSIPDSSIALLFGPSGIRRMVYLRAVHNSQPPGILLIPPLLSHNMNLDTEKATCVKLGLCNSLPKMPTATRVLLGVLNFDKRVHLPLFEKYFYGKKRYLVLNDTIFIPPVRPDNMLQVYGVLGFDQEYPHSESAIMASVLNVELSNNSHTQIHNGAVVISSVTKIELQPLSTLRLPRYALSYALSREPAHKLRAEHALRHSFETLRDVLVAYYTNEFTFRACPCTILLTSPSPRVAKDWVYTCADHLGINVEILDTKEILERTGGVQASFKDKLERASAHEKCIIFLPDINILTANEDGGHNNGTIQFAIRIIIQSIEKCIGAGSSVPTFIASADLEDNVPQHVKLMFLHRIVDEKPSMANTSKFLTDIANMYSVPSIANFDRISKTLVGRTYDTLRYILNCAVREAQNRSITSLITQPHCTPSALDSSRVRLCPVLTDGDFDMAVGTSRTIKLSALSSQSEIKKISWSDVGGLRSAKKVVTEAIKIPLEYGDYLPRGLKRPPGLLFYGPPGTGKTFLARAMASNMGLNFLAVNSSELISPYIGESELNIRNLFSTARQSSPCLMFFDELDSISKRRGSAGASGCVNDRVVAQLLTEIDTISSPDLASRDIYVFVVGATNRPDLLDPAIVRSGRFDKMVYIGPCVSTEEVFLVIKALTRRFQLHPDVDIGQIARSISLPVTSADLYGICSQAYLNATRRIIKMFDSQSEYYAHEKEEILKQGVTVNSNDFDTNPGLYNKSSINPGPLSNYSNFQDEMTTPSSIQDRPPEP